MRKSFCGKLSLFTRLLPAAFLFAVPVSAEDASGESGFHAYIHTHPETVLLAAALIVVTAVLIAVLAVRRDGARNRSLRCYSEIANALSKSYESIYYVNADDDTYLNFHQDGSYAKIYIEETRKDFFEMSKKNLRNVCAEEDLETVTRFIDKERLLKELEAGEAVLPRYRLKIGNEKIWYAMQVIRPSARDPHIIVAVRNINQKVLRIQKEEADAARDAAVISGLSDDFGGVFYVNLDTGREVHYRFDPLLSSSIPGWKEISVFRERIDVLTETLIHQDDRDFFRNMVANKAEILSKLKTEGMFYQNFRILTGETSLYYQLKLVWNKDHPHHIVAGFSNVDVSVRREMEYRRQLEEANRFKSEFLFNMSHDIRTPMNAIIGFAEKARNHTDDREAMEDSLNKIATSGHYLLNLLDEVLNMSRLEAGTFSSRMETVNIPEEGERMMAVFSKAPGAENLTLEYRPVGILHPAVIADRLHVNEIMMNVLGNAIKYTEPGGRVLVTAEETLSDRPGYGRYVFTVEDTGVGMSPEFLSHIFDSFSREGSASTSRVQGAGLGMSIVKRLVDFLGGTIDIASEPGKGTSVAIALPLKFADPAPSPEETRKISPVSLNGMTALLVEDNELNREIASDILSEQGVTVEEAADGIDAVEHVRNRGAAYYDFILMDLQMPNMDGFEAARRIRAIPGTAALPIIALSANALEEDRRKALEAGMNDHVAKPFNVQELLATLSKHTVTA